MINNKLSIENFKPQAGDKCKIHKYRRFSKKNKTYRTDIYYCARCPHYVPINMIFGKPCECWKCGQAFNIPAGKIPLMPECGCKNQTKEILKEGEREKLVDELMNMIEGS